MNTGQGRSEGTTAFGADGDVAPAPRYADSIDFLKRIYPAGPWLLTAIHPEAKATITRTFQPDQEEALTVWLKTQGANHNIYYSVAEPIRAMSKKAGKTELRAIDYLHVDVDPRPGAGPAAEQDRIRALLHNPPDGLVLPTAIIFSGGGLNGLWKLAQPVIVDGDIGKIEVIEEYNRWIAKLLDADACHNADRILRLPGTVNRPDEKKRVRGRVPALAVLEEFDASRVYPLSAFQALPEEKEEHRRPKGGTKGPGGRRVESLDELPATVGADLKALIMDGPRPGADRSKAVVRVCCELLRNGVDEDTVFSIIMDPRFRISAHVQEQADPARCTRRQIEYAKSEVAAGHSSQRSGIDNSSPGGSGLNGGTQSGRDAGPTQIWVAIGPDEHRVVGEAVVGLARDPHLYQRGTQLVRAVWRREEDIESLVIAPVPLPNLRERLTKYVRFYTEDSEGKMCEQHPPDWCVRELEVRAEWPGIRELAGIAEGPFVRPDGTICVEAGYDPATRVLLESSISLAPLPDALTLAHAQAARDELLEVVCDYRFEEPEDQAAWLAAVLTIPARYAFDGPAPLMLFDANTRGAGKGLAVQAIAQIVFGRPLGVSTYPSDPEELRKRITAIALAGDQAILLDNISGTLGNAVLDAALTTTRWQDRLLGKNVQIDLPLRVVWFATANNAAIGDDTARRTIQIRLDVMEENPENRSDFKHPDLLAWVRQERARLLRAALLIVSAYIKAGKPSQGLKPLGSYGGWSGLVRSAVVWLGMPDPAKTQERLANLADTARDALSQVVAAWESHVGHEGVVVADLVSELYPPERSGWPMSTSAVSMRAALEEIVGCPAGKPPSARQVGNRLKSVRRRVVNGAMLDVDPTVVNSKGSVWRLYRPRQGQE